MRRTAQLVDRDHVARLGAVGELRGDLDGLGAVLEQHPRGLAPQPAQDRARERAQHGLAQQLVPEAQPLAGLGQKIHPQRLGDRLEQLRGATVEHDRELLGGEPGPEHSGDAHDLAGVGAQPVQPLAHRLGHAPREFVPDHACETVVDPHTSLLAQPFEQLDEQERIPARVRRELQQRGLADRREVVGHDLGDGIVRKRPQHDPPGAPEASGQLAQRGGARAQREAPEDRQLRGPRHERPQRQQRAGVRGVQVVERDHQRPVERGGLEHVVDLLDQPEAELRRLGRRVGAPEPAVEQRRQQRGERHGALAFEGLGGYLAQPRAPGDRRRLGEQPRLADPRRALDQQHAARAAGRRGDELSDRRQLVVATPQPHRTLIIRASQVRVCTASAHPLVQPALPRLPVSRGEAAGPR